MGQKLLKFDGTPADLNDLEDVVISNPADFDTVIRLGSQWINLNISNLFLSAFSLKTVVKDNSYTAVVNTINIINSQEVSNININLPASPTIGDRLLFIDYKNSSPQTTSIDSWANVNVNLLAPTNYYITGRPNIRLSQPKVYSFLFSTGNNWIDLTAQGDNILTINASPYAVDAAYLGATLANSLATTTLDLQAIDYYKGFYINFINLANSPTVNLTTTLPIQYANNNTALLSTQYLETKLLNIGSQWIVS